jgi:plastocyanin
MTKDVKSGDKVRWTSHGGRAHGTVETKQTGPTRIKGHKVAASPDDPQFIVKTNDGKHAAHKAEALTKD